MKKYLLPLIALFLITGCGSTNDNNKEEDHGELVTSQWGEDIAKASFDALGYVLPYIDCESFDYEEGIDAYEDSYVAIYAYYETDEEATDAIETYYNILDKEQFKLKQTTDTYFDEENLTFITYDVCYGDKVFNNHDGVEVQFLASTWNNKPCLGIFGFSYFAEKDKTVWPSASVDHVFEKAHQSIDVSSAQVIPFVDETNDAITYATSFEIVEGELKYAVLNITCYNATMDSEDNYLNTLKSSLSYPYTIDDTYYDDGEGYYAYALDKSHVINFYYSIDYVALIMHIFVPMFNVNV